MLEFCNVVHNNRTGIHFIFQGVDFSCEMLSSTKITEDLLVYIYYFGKRSSDTKNPIQKMCFTYFKKLSILQNIVLFNLQLKVIMSL